MEAFYRLIEDHQWYEAAQALRPLCSTSIDGIRDWLSHGDENHIHNSTMEDLAAEWDEYNQEDTEE